MSPIYVPGKLTLRQTYIGTDDPDAAAYIAAVEAADGEELETGVQVAIHSFVKGCKADGIWPALKASCILAGARTLAGALVPLLGTAPTKFGTEASWSYNRETGLKGNGTNNYLDTNRANNADLQNNNHNSLYITEELTVNVAHMGAGSNTSGANNIGSGGSVMFFRNRNVSVATPTLGGSTPYVGFAGISRSAPGSFQARYSSVTETFAISSEVPNPENVRVFSRGSVSPAFSSSRIAFYSIGEALDLALLDARVTDLINAIGVAIP